MADVDGEGRLLVSPVAQELLVVLAAVLLRVLVGLSSYSGASDPPKFGDYEAQRHWMEVTTHLPPSQWYVESVYNNVSYWPLDYPPLSGYQSWVHGQFMKATEPAAVAPLTSHGYETPSSKKLMRFTVLMSDLLFFFPAAFAAARTLHGRKPGAARARCLAALLLNPATIIIDHGHFQYNCISLGLALGAAAAIGDGAHLLGSALFCAALSHKQMCLYYAPAFFAHLLGRCLGRRGLLNKAWGVVRLGLTVATSFGFLWAPWLTSIDAVKQVAARIFPLRRGLYEDYVANWWCVSSVGIKWKEVVPSDAMVLVCLASTLAALLPCMAHQLWRPSRAGLLLCMANSAAAFFMFSYQVHEKSVLLPLVPALALTVDQPTVGAFGPLVALVSMYPLLDRDGLTLPYVGLALIWAGLTLAWAPPGQFAAATVTAHRRSPGLFSWVARLFWGAFVAASVTLHVVQRVVPPPPTLPWLYDRAFVTLGFGGLAVLMLSLQAAQWGLQPERLGQPAVPQAQVMRKKRE